jgi:ABC-type amino acid transport substrate-binding protein
MAELTAARALKGHRVGMVGGSVEQVLLNEVGAIAMPVASDAELLPLLDQQKVDYVLMSTTTLEQSLQKGFSDRYQVVFRQRPAGTHRHGDPVAGPHAAADPHQGADRHSPLTNSPPWRKSGSP